MAGPSNNDEEKKVVSLRQEGSLIPRRHDPGRTLLPGPLASVISLATKSSSISLQIGTFIARRIIDGARVTSLTSLDLTRAAVESILLSAGHDVISRTRGELGKMEAEGLLEHSMAFLHSGLTQAAFLVATGFHVSSATVSFASALSQHVLTLLDSILGSTESSRAIASIITLIRREFRNPMTGVKGERVGLMDLLVGAVGLALLQRWARKTTEKEIRERRAEEVIWDVIVLNNGKRADVVGVKDQHGNTSYRSSVAGRHTEGPLTRRSSFISVTGETDILDVMWSNEDGLGTEDTLESDIEHYVQEQLPPHANISVTTKTITTQTVIVEISGTAVPHIETPPGFIVVEKTAIQGPSDALRSWSTPDVKMSDGRRYRIVYQAVNRRPQKQIANRPNKLRLKESFESRPATHLMTPLHDYTTSVESATVQILPPSTSTTDDHIQDLANDERQMSWTNEQHKARSTGMESPGTEPQDQVEHDVSITSLRKLASEWHPGPSAKPSEPLNGTSKSTSFMAKFSLARFVPGLRQNSSENLSKSSSTRRPSANTKNEDHGSAVAAHWKDSRDQEPFPAFRLENPEVDPRAELDRHISSSRFSHISRTEKSQPGKNHLSSPEMKSNGWALASPPFSTSRSHHRGRSNSIISQTDSHSSGSPHETRSNSPVLHMHSSQSNRLVRRTSDKEVTVSDQAARTSQRVHQRSRSYVPSIYTLRSNASETSLVAADSSSWRLPYDQRVIRGLFRTGRLIGSYPPTHLIKNVTRFVRFASASYGSHFLRVMGIAASEGPKLLEHDPAHHHEHQSFSNHARLSASTILLSSFVDPQGGTNARGETDTGLPLVHFVSLDHESKAVVLTCRGTLGFEDVLTDMVCEYDDLYWRGTPYKVHKGIHASARRLLRGSGSRVVATIQAAMEEFSEYGLILCGHSLGAAVAALLAIMISEPASRDISSCAFVTASKPPDPQPWPGRTGSMSGLTSTWLPSGRPVHVYAFGPPATVSPSLRLATRGLITTIINGQDVVPSLSLGILNDMQAVALAFKTDPSNAKGEVRGRIWEGLLGGLNRGWHDQRAGIVDPEEDQWACSALKSLRASMVSPKLLPPGNIFVVETQSVLQRDAFVSEHDPSVSRYPRLGRPATRAILKYVRDVESRFREIRFGGGMLSDHSPGRYEISLAALSNGVLDDIG